MVSVTRILAMIYCCTILLGGVCFSQDTTGSEGVGTPGDLQQSQSSPADIKSTALEKARERDFESAKAIVESGLKEDPYSFDLEIVLAKVLLAEAAHAKKMKLDYKGLIKRPYRMGKRLYKANPYRPEPYYIVARSLIIFGQYQRAGKAIQKALHFARGRHEDLALYYEALGDSWQNIKDHPRAYGKAKSAYQGALYGAGKDMVLRKRLEWKLKRLDKRFGYK